MNVPGIRDKCLGYSVGLLLMNKLVEMYTRNCSLMTFTNVKGKVNVMVKYVLLFSSHSTVSMRNT